MAATLWDRRSPASTVAALSLAVLWLHGGQIVVWASEPEVNAEAIRADITIKARQFHPSPVWLPVGQPVMLVFTNQDVELHAFVPKRFLEHLPVHVDGNGAPQFGDTGLERVLIPSGGREEIHFVPAATGIFEYRCDLPGHQMVGKIVVENRSADRYTVGEQRTDVQGTP
jgi:plastocyanin